jgi:hypothetical protein
VASTQALASVRGVDATEALALPGAVAYIGADDVPGANKVGGVGDAEEIFATEKVQRRKILLTRNSPLLHESFRVFAIRTCHSMAASQMQKQDIHGFQE